MNDDQIIKQRISGRSVRAIAKAQGCSVTDVNRVLDHFTETTIDEQLRRHTMALELARLDELQETFFARARAGDLQSAALCAKLIERRGVLLGLHAPITARLQIVEGGGPPRETPSFQARGFKALSRARSHGSESAGASRPR